MTTDNTTPRIVSTLTAARDTLDRIGDTLRFCIIDEDEVSQ